LAIKLKEQMSSEKILAREEELLNIVWDELESIPKLHLLADMHRERLGILSFYVEDLHYNLIVKLLNDKFGVQVRGGCSCAGTYGHYLLHVDPTRSKRITDKINHGDFSEKPGWVRFSLHPTMTNDEVRYILNSIEQIIEKGHEWEKDYSYNSHSNEFTHKNGSGFLEKKIDQWFKL
jgi:selenocysteine lyase/cysteine desulfurase